MIAQALLSLADIAICTSNDFHAMHHNYHGLDFDMLHKKVLQKYYEKAAEDADLWSEAACMFDAVALNYNNAAARLHWNEDTSIDDTVTRDDVIQRCYNRLQTYNAALLIVYNELDNDKCYLSVGVQNTVQTAIEYWSKEEAYFNARRA